MKKLIILMFMMVLFSSFVSADISIRADANFKDTIDTYKVQEYGKTYLVNDKPLVQDKNLKVYQSMNVINDDEEVSLFIDLMDSKLSNDYVICFDFGHFVNDFIIISGEQVKQFWFNKNLLSTGVFEFLNYKCMNSIDISNFNEIKYRLKYEGFIPYKNYQIKYDVIIFPYYDNLALKGSFSDSKYHNNLIVLDPIWEGGHNISDSSTNVLRMSFDNNINDTSGNNVNISYYKEGLAGYDFKLNQDSNDIFSSHDGIDINMNYDYTGAIFNEGGTSQVNVTNTASALDVTNFTIIMDLTIKGINQAGVFYSIYSTPGERIECYFNGNIGQVQCSYKDVGDVTHYVNSVTNWDFYESNRIVHMYNGSHHCLFMDSVSTVDCVASTDDPVLSSADWSIGLGHSGWYGINGSLKNFYIHNRSFSTAEISNIFTDGNYTNGATGLTNTSMSFNGIDESINTGTSLELFDYNTTGFTFSIWINPYVTTGKIIDFEGRGYLWFNGNEYEWRIYSDAYFEATGTEATVGTWTHVIGVWNTTAINIYENGQLTESTTTHSIGSTNDVIRRTSIGSEWDNVGYYFNGLLDEYNIWNYVLNDSEIEQVYSGYDNYSWINWYSITTNLSTSSISWPELSFDINISINNNDWNESPTCQMVDNVSWVSCTPATDVISLSVNETTFTCTASERNTGDVLVYANCSSTSFPLSNSSSYVYSITADSNPVVDANFSASYNLFTLESLSLNITGSDWTEQPTSCIFTYNDTGITCLDIGLIDDSNYQYSNTTTCTPDYIQEKDYNVTITCDGSLYTDIIASNIVTIDADSNPTLAFDNLSNSNGNNPLVFDVQVSGDNIYETMSCNIIDNSANIACSDFSLSANQTDNSYNITTCTTSGEFAGDVYFMMNCDSALYLDINSSNTSIVIDTLMPVVTVTAPANNNQSWNYINDTYTLAGSCSHSSPINITQFNITCVDSSDDIAFSHNITNNNGSLSYTNTTAVFNYVDDFTCEFKCVDNSGHTTTTRNTLATIEMNITKSNISDFRQVNTNFSINAPFDFNGDTATCAMIANDSQISCLPFTGTTPANFSCGTTGSISTNVTFYMQCNDTTRTWISDTRTLDSSYIYVDRIDPSITINSWTANHTYFSQNITGNFTFADNESLYSWNVSIDGVTVDSATNVAYNSYPYNLSIDPSTYNPGFHNLSLSVSDGHTAQEIPDFKVKTGGFFDDSYIKFETPDGNVIEISAKDKKDKDVFKTNKEKDRYTFSFTPIEDDTRTDMVFEKVKNKELNIEKGELSKEEKYKDIIFKKLSFKVKCKETIYIVNRPDTQVGTWLVCGQQWIDFYNDESANDVINYVYDLSSDEPFKTVDVDVYYDGDIKKPIKFKSIGNLNTVTYNSTFYTVNVTITYTSTLPQATDNIHNFRMNITGTPIGFNNVSANFTYNNTAYNPTKTSTATYVNWAKTVTSPNTTSTVNVPFIWNVTMVGEPSKLYYFNQSVFFTDISSNCSQEGYVETMRFCGYKEASPFENVSDMMLNINFNLLEGDGLTIVKQFGFKFDNASCYPLCIYPNTTTYQVNAKMEYGDDNYTDRKYYLSNYTLTNVSSTVSLFHILAEDSSDVAITVYDKNTGDRIKNAYVKILRYYPGLDNSSEASYKTVEVEQTDVNGETLGKMILADVWYKFIVEYPAGNVILNTDIEKILTLDKLLPVSLTSGNLLAYNEMIQMNTDLSCTWLATPPICTYTWSNPTGTDVIGTLKLYQNTGFKKILTYESSVTSSAATIAYSITENTTNKRYEAEGWISR